MHKSVRNSHGSRRGFALLAALWLVVAIATIALEFGVHAHEARSTTLDLAEQTQAMAAAMAGVETERARFDLLNQQLQQGHAPAGLDSRYPQLSVIAALRVVDSESVGSGMFRAQLRNGGEWLNINTMSETMWRQFLIGVGLDYDSADRLAQAIMDWRDPDDFARPRGAERDTYLQTHAFALPTNRNFTAVTELRDVLGMTPALYTKIAPYLSVCTSGHIDLDDADRLVLYAVPGFTEEIVETAITQRTTLPFNGGSLNGLDTRVSAEGRASLTANAAFIQRATNFSTSWEYVVVSTGWSANGHSSATVLASITPGNPESTLLWTCNE